MIIFNASENAAARQCKHVGPKGKHWMKHDETPTISKASAHLNSLYLCVTNPCPSTRPMRYLHSISTLISR